MGVYETLHGNAPNSIASRFDGQLYDSEKRIVKSASVARQTAAGALSRYASPPSRQLEFGTEPRTPVATGHRSSRSQTKVASGAETAPPARCAAPDSVRALGGSLSSALPVPTAASMADASTPSSTPRLVAFYPTAIRSMSSGRGDRAGSFPLVATAHEAWSGAEGPWPRQPMAAAMPMRRVVTSAYGKTFSCGDGRGRQPVLPTAAESTAALLTPPLAPATPAHRFAQHQPVWEINTSNTSSVLASELPGESQRLRQLAGRVGALRAERDAAVQLRDEAARKLTAITLEKVLLTVRAELQAARSIRGTGGASNVIIQQQQGAGALGEAGAAGAARMQHMVKFLGCVKCSSFGGFLDAAERGQLDEMIACCNYEMVRLRALC